MAAEWAIESHRAIDLFGEFARERHLLLFQSGNECEFVVRTVKLVTED